jgi:rare lipoprotein A
VNERGEGRLSSNGLHVAALALLLASCGMPERPGPIARPERPVSDTPVKIGRPYQVAGITYVPADDRAYDEVGLASWYGPQFHGLATANGERFDMDRIGAAHKTLPLPCYAEVTALDTGRTILVRINDRGPFVANRIIDLSRGAARLLSVEGKGVARVRVRRVEPPESERAMLRLGRPATPRPDIRGQQLAALKARYETLARPAPVPVVAAAPPAFVLPGVGQYVQVGAFGDRTRAESAAAAISGIVVPGGAMWRVRIGPFFSEADAREALARARARGYQNARLIEPSDTN